MKKLKVYGFHDFNKKGGQQRRVVAAHSFAEAARLFGCSVYHLKHWGAITGNPVEIKKAMAKPGTPVWIGEEI